MVRNFRCKIHLLLLLIFFVIVIKKVNAHHLRAGDITIELISCQSYTYLLTITGYTDNRIKLEFGYEVLDFGDGTFIDLDTCKPYSMVDLGEFVTQKIFRIKHTFPGPGNYTIRYHEPNRNDNVLNMYNSGYVAFYVETQVIIDPFLFCNNTPILLNPPIDKGVVGQIYEHNPAAWDPDGDSLAYKLVPCKQNRDMNVPGYTLPSLHDIQEVGAKNYLGTGPATISMDSLSGDLIWDSPAIKGQYNVAFIVEEWRMINGEWYKLGYVTRDMQILIDDSENHPPRLYLPQDTCVEVGTKLEVEIFAEDPDGHDVTIETFSGIFNLFGFAVRLDPDSVFPQSSPARVQLIWETHCNHVRKKPYQIIFKATDHPTELNEQPPLVDFGSWFVTIVAPAPTGLTATVSPDNEVVLNWDPYVCTSAETMQIWRRIGDYEFEYGHCETGIPESAGYEMIGEVPISDTTFIDSGEQTELSYNAKYCYRLVATFPPPRNGESYPSEKACIIIGMNNVPVITHVDVEKTGEYDGEIIVRWIPPITMDDEVYELPYIYRLFRSESISTDHNPDEIAELNFENTIYLDHDINTLNKTYYYQVKLFDAKDSLLVSSPFASSVIGFIQCIDIMIEINRIFKI
jgi:hypothetical protein